MQQFAFIMVNSKFSHDYLGRGRKIVQGEFSVFFHIFSLPFLGCFAQRVCVCVCTLVLSYFPFEETKNFFHVTQMLHTNYFINHDLIKDSPHVEG